jgi:hypothetical protein
LRCAKTQSLLEGLQHVVARLPQALAAAELERLSHALAQEVPALACPLNSARWRAEIRTCLQ